MCVLLINLNLNYIECSSCPTDTELINLALLNKSNLIPIVVYDIIIQRLRHKSLLIVVNLRATTTQLQGNYTLQVGGDAFVSVPVTSPLPSAVFCVFF